MREWLLVSHAQLGGEPWAELLVSKETEMWTIEIAKARGAKCERCWQYTVDIRDENIHQGVCGRCSDVLRRI